MFLSTLRKVDLILLHAPSIYDFRKIPNLLGPISDVIPSTPIFEMYPIGFSSIVHHLRKHRHSVRIINLAYRMLDDPGFDVEKFISKLKTKAFGIDLHWLPHAHGSIEIAKICKKYHPEIPIMFGGYSSTYFHKELIQYPEVDFVLRGDTTEEAVRQLLVKIINKENNYSTISGLTWLDSKNNVVANTIEQYSADLEQNSNEYKYLFKMAVKYFDLKNMTAIRDWWEYPITVVMTCRGCTQNCAICGGSQKALTGYIARKKLSQRKPELVANDIGRISKFTRAPIFVVGDLHQTGYDYAMTFFKQLKKYKVKNELVFELFTGAKQEFFDWLANAVPNFNFEMSPESHDSEIRKASGKHYPNEAMEKNIEWAFERGCKKFDIFFIIGLPYQTYDSVMETVDYCEYLVRKFGKRLVPFISPLAPFLDPGSLAYEQPDKYGYTIRFHKLADYRRALLQPSWKHVFNYETKWMDRETIVQATYAAGERLTQIKAHYGLISSEKSQHTLENLKRARERHQKIEALDLDNDFSVLKSEDLEKLNLHMDQDSISTICHKHELRWPQARRSFNFAAIIKAILFE